MLFTVFDNLSAYVDTQLRKKIQRAKDIVSEVRRLEKEEMPYSAENEVKRLIP
jgi:hypothetical protein